jgi:uncharacterized protein (TIGR02231 family)
MKTMTSKSILAGLALIILIGPSSASGSEIKADAPITAVTVYPDRAMITRSITLDLAAGDHTVVIDNLPVGVLDDSFRGSLQGGQAILLGLNYHIVRHTEIPQAKVAELDERIYNLENYERLGIVNRKEIFEQQKKILLSIGFKSGQEMSEQMDKGGLDIAQWHQAFDFVGEAMRAVNDSLSVVKRELDILDRQLAKLKGDRGAFSGQLSLQTKTVELEVCQIRTGTATVELDYVIGGAGWRPIYDARLNEETDKVDFAAFGEVAQKTGEDWNEVELVLSTSRPALGTGPGALAPWFLSLFAPPSRNMIMSAPAATVDDLLQRETGITTDSDGVLKIRGGRSGETSYLIDGVNFSDPLAGVISSNYNTAFKVTRKITIPSGEESVRAPIGEYSLKRHIDNICRPRNRLGVFRLATITNQDKAPLLPGRVAIFAGSDFLGNTNLGKFIASGQEFDLPFGRDNNIEVEREITNDTRAQKGDKVRIDQTIKITLTNNGREESEVAVEEILPVARDQRIKVDIRDIQPQLDESSESAPDRAVWTVSLKSGETRTITYSYRIEYPSDMRLQGI